MIEHEISFPMMGHMICCPHPYPLQEVQSAPGQGRNGRPHFFIASYASVYFIDLLYFQYNIMILSTRHAQKCHIIQICFCKLAECRNDVRVQAADQRPVPAARTVPQLRHEVVVAHQPRDVAAARKGVVWKSDNEN